MSFHLLLLSLAPAFAPAAPAGDLVAIRVGRAETVSHGPIDHAVILVEDGKIVAIGPDLPVERGIPIVDHPEWTAMPGLVLPYSRIGLDGRAGTQFSPDVTPKGEVLPRDPQFREALELGFTTIGLYPPGSGIPGESIVVRPHGDSLEEMLIKTGAYLKVYFRADARSKKMVKDAWAKVDEYDEKVKKAKEKWTKDQEKSKSKKSGDSDKDKKDEKADESKGDEKSSSSSKKTESKEFTPPAPDPKVKPFLDIRDGKLRPLVSISQSADWAHWLDAIGDRKFDFALRVVAQRELDLYEVEEELKTRGCAIVIEPELSYQVGTMRQRCIPAELSNLGLRVTLLPRNDGMDAHADLRRDAGEMVKYGMTREAALKSITLEGAAILGMESELGSLDKDKVANLVFFNGDPLEVGTKVEAVMLDGEFVYGEVRQ